MIQAWSSEKGGDATCEKCGSIYSVTITRLPFKDIDSFNCEVCNHLMREWKNTRVPEYTLKTTGEIPNK